MAINDKQSLFSRDNSLILRGVAIVFIMLHNFLHLPNFGFPAENEMSFSSEKACAFFYALSNGGGFGEFMSHLGWIGVPVFLFLTGYGVALNNTVNKGKSNYIKRGYLKLLALMMPAILFFAGLDFVKGDIMPGLLKRFSYLTMLTNFAYPYLNCNPGVYWYFGLTFQFYVIWALMGQRMNRKNLLGWSIVLTLVLYVLCVFASPEALSIFKHCFTGWFPVFAIGVWTGLRKQRCSMNLNKSVWMELLLFVVLLGLILLMSRWMMTWLLLPIVALAWFVVIGLLLKRTRYLSEVFRWVGKYSACVFVCHPIARTIVLNAVNPRFPNLTINVLIYIALTMVIALLYDIVYQWLLSKMLPKTV